MFDFGRADFVKPLKKLFDLTGVTQMSLGSGVVPTVKIGELGAPPFHSKQGFAVGETVAAVAGEYAYFILSNESTSKHIVCKSITATMSLAGGWEVQRDPGFIVAPHVYLPSWDLAITEFDHTTILRRATSANVGSAERMAYVRVPADTPFTIYGPWVLPPSSWLAVRSAGWNTTGWCTMYGDVYSL